MTAINRMKQTASGPVFLIDLGDTCAVEAWVCRATEGRAPFLVLDAMGYDAAVIGGPEQVPIPIPSLRKLAGSISLSLVVWNRSVKLTKRGIMVTVAAGDAETSTEIPDDQTVIHIDRRQNARPKAGESRPKLGDVAKGNLARIDMTWPDCTVLAAQHLAIAADVPADPTIAAIIDLVEYEAEQYMQQPRGGEA